MKSTPFVQGQDLEPIPFSPEHCLLAKNLKRKDLTGTHMLGVLSGTRAASTGSHRPSPTESTLF